MEKRRGPRTESSSPLAFQIRETSKGDNLTGLHFLFGNGYTVYTGGVSYLWDLSNAR